MIETDFAEYDDRALAAAIEAWQRACEASRFEAHIDVADRIRNQLVAEKLRRDRLAG